MESSRGRRVEKRVYEESLEDQDDRMLHLKKPKLLGLARDFISSSKALHELKSYKFLAEGLKIASQVGAAIGVIRHELTNVQKKTPGEESWRLVFKQEIDEVTALLKKYEHENDFVWREKDSGSG
ncbi:unnamed protein product [Camellia sinensis]